MRHYTVAKLFKALFLERTCGHKQALHSVYRHITLSL